MQTEEGEKGEREEERYEGGEKETKYRESKYKKSISDCFVYLYPVM